MFVVYVLKHDIYLHADAHIRDMALPSTHMVNIWVCMHGVALIFSLLFGYLFDNAKLCTTL